MSGLGSGLLKVSVSRDSGLGYGIVFRYLDIGEVPGWRFDFSIKIGVLPWMSMPQI